MSKKVFNLTGFGMTLQTPTELEEPTDKNGGYELKKLDPQCTVYKEIMEDFDNAGLIIHEIEQLSNHLLWTKYTNERKLMMQNSHFVEDSAIQLNEKYLYHGTSCKKDFICTESLDSRLSKRGCFGQGIYFSDTPAKCVKYAEKGGDTPYILLARVILGCSKVYGDGARDPLLRREPEKKFPYKGWRFYDSVIGVPKDFKEFVVYRNDRALIEYIITYSSAEQATAASSDSRNHHVPIPLESSFSGTHNYGKPSTKPVDRINGMKKAASQHNDDDSTTDEENNGDSSDSDEYKDCSSDTIKLGKDKAQNKKRFSTESVEKVPTFKAGKDILSEKRDEFRRRTGERKLFVIESFLSAAKLDLSKAIWLYNEKERNEKERLEQLNSNMIEEFLSDEEVDNGAGCSTVESVLTVSERLSNATEEDKTAIIKSLCDNFITVVGLDDNDGNQIICEKILVSCDYDFNSAIIAYYEFYN